MQLQTLCKKIQKCTKGFSSNVMARFNFKEAIRVGVFSTLIYNTLLYIPAIVTIREWDAFYVLFLMMVVVPTITCLVFIRFP